MLKTLSLFSGIGGFEVAAEVVGGFNITDAVEKNPFRQQVLAKNFPSLNIHDDIIEFKSHIGQFDCIIGGFPCKGMSVAGKSEGYENKHSALWWEMLRIISECQPKFVVIENVRGFINKGLRECLASLRMAGYNFDVPQIVSAKELGAPHKRERVFVVAYSNSLVWREQPTEWSGQIRNQVEAVRDAAYDCLRQSDVAKQRRIAPRDCSIGQWSAEPKQDCLQREVGVATQTEEFDETGSWSEPGRQDLSCREVDTTQLQFSSFVSGMGYEFSSELHENRELNEMLYRDGWWATNPFVGEISAPKRSMDNRQARISALGDSVTPQQAAIPLMRVNYLMRSLLDY